MSTRPLPFLLNVDDNEIARYARSRTLRHAGFEVLEAASGAQALASVERHAPALVLLDVQLPDGLGTELRALLRHADGRARVPVIWITADPGIDAAHGEIVLHKPVTALKLRSALDAARRAAVV